MLSPRYFEHAYFHFDLYGPANRTSWFLLLSPGSFADLIPNSSPCPCSSASTLCSSTRVQILQLATASEADHSVKTVFHLPLTCFLRTLQWCYCLIVLTLSHLAESQITLSNTAWSCVMNKSLFHDGLSCTFSLNSQNHHTFPIQISTKNSFVPSTYNLKIIIKALGYPFLWVSQRPCLTPLTEMLCIPKKWAHWQFLETKELKKSFLCISSSLLPQSHLLKLYNDHCFPIFCTSEIEEKGWQRCTGVYKVTKTVAGSFSKPKCSFVKIIFYFWHPLSSFLPTAPCFVCVSHQLFRGSLVSHYASSRMTCLWTGIRGCY